MMSSKFLRVLHDHFYYVCFQSLCSKKWLNMIVYSITCLHIGTIPITIMLIFPTIYKYYYYHWLFQLLLLFQVLTIPIIIIITIPTTIIYYYSLVQLLLLFQLLFQLQLVSVSLFHNLWTQWLEICLSAEISAESSANKNSHASDRCTCFDHASSRRAAWKRSPHTEQNGWTEMGGEKKLLRNGWSMPEEMDATRKIVDNAVANRDRKHKSSYLADGFL